MGRNEQELVKKINPLPGPSKTVATKAPKPQEANKKIGKASQDSTPMGVPVSKLNKNTGKVGMYIRQPNGDYLPVGKP